MLLGHYIEQLGGKVNYYDTNTNDLDLKIYWTDVYVIAYWDDHNSKISFPKWATVIDIWRNKNIVANIEGELVRYGDTRISNEIHEVPEQLHKKNVKEFYEFFPELSPYEKDIYVCTAKNLIAVRKRSMLTTVKEIETQIDQGKTKIVFNGYREGLMLHVIKKIHRTIDMLGNKSKGIDFYCVVGATNGQEDYEILTDYIGGKEFKVTILHCDYFHYKIKLLAEKMNVEYKVEPKEKKFVCFNRKLRPHRQLLLEKLLQHDLVKDSFYSYYNFENYAEWERNIDKIGDNFSAIKSNKHIFPLKLNITEDRPNPANIIDDDLCYYSDSYFSIVTETMFYDSQTQDAYPIPGNSIFFTEKTYKPIALMHPFILVARSGSLKILKQKGYKTFHPFIDESYDEIQDDALRLDAVVNEIKRLCLMNSEELLQWQTNIKDIVEHNYNNMLSVTKFTDNDLVNDIIGNK